MVGGDLPAGAIVKQHLKLVKTIGALFQNGHIVGYVSWESSKPLTEETT